MSRQTVGAWLFRVFMVVTLPISFPVVVIAIAGREFGHAAHMTWLGMRLEWASLVRMLRDPPIKGGKRA
jgi:hypothetical protein